MVKHKLELFPFTLGEIFGFRVSNFFCIYGLKFG